MFRINNNTNEKQFNSKRGFNNTPEDIKIQMMNAAETHRTNVINKIDSMLSKTELGEKPSLGDKKPLTEPTSLKGLSLNSENRKHESNKQSKNLFENPKKLQ